MCGSIRFVPSRFPGVDVPGTYYVTFKKRVFDVSGNGPFLRLEFRHFDVLASGDLDALTGLDWYEHLGNLANSLGESAYDCRVLLSRDMQDDDGEIYSEVLCRFDLGLKGSICESEVMYFTGFSDLQH